MKLSILIPACNEEGSITSTVEGLIAELCKAAIPFEVVMVDDYSIDGTAGCMRKLNERYADVVCVSNLGQKGFGMAIRAGLEQCKGDAVAVVMADGSDDPADLVRYYRKLPEGYDCVFGSRFIRGSAVVDYPVHKLLLKPHGELVYQSSIRVALQ